MEKKDLQPAAVFDFFAEINAVPRRSKHEEKMIEYLRAFGEKRGLVTRVDKTGNVMIRKGATQGYERRRTVVLQSHIDMVCDKLVDVDFDFDRDAIQTYIDGEWLRARGTTLGADDGMGVAMELALLDADDIEHGPVECVFTRDEETALTGATNMEAGFMTGDMLINLDSENEGEFFVSCAGGRNTTALFAFTREEAPDAFFFLRGALKGLQGGHSGDDIEKKRANAIKLLGRFLYQEMCKYDVRLASFDAGKAHNAIPRDGAFVIAVPDGVKELVRADWNVFAANVEDEYHVSDAHMVFDMESADARTVLPKAVSVPFIQSLQAVDNGVYAMCQDDALAYLVETSSNIASVVTSESDIRVVTSQRSNVMSALDNMCDTIKAVFELAGATVQTANGYPAWKMRPDSTLTKIAVDTYRKLFGKEPVVKGIHAGLECGLFSEKYPEMDMVSIGPTLRGVHSPDERLLIPTVQMVWDHLKEILKNIPERKA